MTRLGALSHAIAVALTVWLVPLAARAGDIEDFETARTAYEARDFSRAVFYFEELVGGERPRLRSAALVAEGRKYLGAAYLFVGRRDAAREQFERLLGDQPDYRLDPLRFPTEVQELFESVRERLALERREREARAGLEAALALERERSARLLEFAEQEFALEVEHSRWLALIPFGVGQFENGDPTLGWTFLITETVLAGAATGGFVAQALLSARILELQEMEDDGRVPEWNEWLRAAQIVNWVSLGLLGIFAIAGIAEAQVSFPVNPTVRHRRQLPENLRPRALISVDATGFHF